MNGATVLQAYAEVFGAGRLPLSAPVRVAGESGHISGRTYRDERYDVTLGNNTVLRHLSREQIEIDWKELTS